MSIQALILTKIKDERARQDEKWGVQLHSLPMWLTILGEEFGEACKEACGFTSSTDIIDRATALINFKKELIQVAAVCVATLEHLETSDNLPYPLKRFTTHE